MVGGGTVLGRRRVNQQRLQPAACGRASTGVGSGCSREEWKLICDNIAEVDKHKSHELFPCHACDKLPGSEPPDYKPEDHPRIAGHSGYLLLSFLLVH